MSDELQKVMDAVHTAFDRAELKWPPDDAAPTPLSRLIDCCELISVELPDLSPSAIRNELIRRGVDPHPLEPGGQRLAGFMFAQHGRGFLFVNRSDIVPRRRFTAAHELGHFLMHVPSDEISAEPWIVADDHTAATVREEDPEALTKMEREANRFAAEILMPSNLMRRLHNHYLLRFGPTARFIEHHLASDLLVSREAIRWRLLSLGLGKPPVLTETVSRLASPNDGV